MELYQYKAMDENGRTHVGRVDAMNDIDLEMRLQKLGLDLISFVMIETGGKSTTGAGIRRRDLIMFCFHVEQTARAGVPILESMQDLRDSTDNPRMVEVITSMIEAVESGSTLSEAMKDFPKVFSDVFVNLVQAGEQSGELAEVFLKLGENLKWQDELVSQTKQLMIYPAIVFPLIMGVVAFLMTYVVPKLLAFIKNMGHELPMHTKVLVALSNIFSEYWYLILLAPILLIFSVYLAIKTSPGFHLWFDTLKLKIPLFGNILKKIILTRLVGFFAMMYGSGITIIECIRTSEQIAGNKAIQLAVRNVGQEITDGASLSDAFASADLFPPLVLRMIKVGETTGNLQEALQNISYFYDRDIKESISRLQAMIQPGLVLFLGGIVIWIIFSVLGPIYDLITKIKI